MTDTRVAKYGPEYEQLLLHAFAALPFTFQLENHGQAKLFQAKTYGYFRALRKENLRLDLIEMADNLSLSVDEDKVIFNLKANVWDVKKIREQLKLPEDFHEQGTTGNGQELKAPDLLGPRLAKQLQAIRERKASAANIVPPFKTEK